jgi:hypothetical protein
MDFEQELNRLADAYARQGFQVTIRPDPVALPPFADDFQVEILGKRGAEGVLVSVKQDRGGVAADSNLTRYAEVTGSQEGWRFDLAVLEAERPGSRELEGAEEFSEEEIDRSFSESLEMIRLGFPGAALMTAWAGFEAGMRLRLRAAGGRADWGATPRSLLNELYSNGFVNVKEFRELEALHGARNRVVHGFAYSWGPGGAVPLLCEIGRRLVQESRDARVPA